MKFIRSLAGAALAVAVAFAAAAEAQPTTLRIDGAFVAEHTSSKAMEIFKTEAARLSGGSIEVEVVPQKLGDGVREIIEDVRAGRIFAIWIGVANMSRLVPEVGAVTLPFVFDNYDQVMHAVGGPAGTSIEAKLGAKGFTALAWMQLGARNVTNSRRPLRTLDDFKGLKIRLQPNETHVATFRAIGANPVAMELKDLYAALRQGDIDGHENPYSIIHDYGFFENQRYLSDSGHFLDLIVFVANKKAFGNLELKQQKAIREAAAIAAAQQRKMATAAELAALAGLKDKGMQFDSLPAGTRAALRQATAGVIDDVRKRVGTELVDQVLAAAKGAGKSGNR